MYAWSRFAKDVNEWGRAGSYVNPGDEITQDDLGLSDDAWQELIDMGAVREEKYPDVNAGESPAEYFIRNPDEAPEVPVDTETPVEQAKPLIDTAIPTGSKLPGATAVEEAQKEAAKEETPSS